MTTKRSQGAPGDQLTTGLMTPTYKHIHTQQDPAYLPAAIGIYLSGKSYIRFLKQPEFKL